jgi:DNA ligase-1|tara:strand:- start:77 stop:1342 length:1266 start_codon:yes stop_codon:yes gene_type:complete
MEELEKFIEEMRSTSSATDKIAIIKRSSAFIHKILEATYNPYKQYHITSKTCKKNNGLFKYNTHTEVFTLLDDLTNRVYTGHNAIAQVNGFKMAVDGGGLVYKIIDKDLDIRVGASIINKAIPGLIPTFKVALAQNYEGKCDWNDRWWVSRKLDGVRCLAITDEEGKCKLYSRMGKEFTTLDKVKEAIEATGIINSVFDGEICLVDEEGNEDFQGVMKQLRRKNHQIENPAFMIFDMLFKPEFEAEKSERKLYSRLIILKQWLRGRFIDESILRFTHQTLITDQDHFEYWNTIENKDSWEGLMLRKDVGYEGKRTKNLVKVKSFHDAEYEVLGWDIDQHEVVREGKSVSMTMLAQVWIEHKGHIVKVGSGFTQEQRLEYMDGSIVGKTITVQYFEETKNDRGGISLRFPTVKIVHGDKREM